MPDDGQPHYCKPGWFTRHVFNPMVRALTNLGVSILGSRELRVRGRTSGEMRKTVVNLLTVDGTDYLVAPRGETQWVRNLRAAGEGELRVGRKVERFTATEIPVADRSTLLREYLRRWKAETGVFFDGVTADSSESELARIAPDHPAFRLSITRS